MDTAKKIAIGMLAGGVAASASVALANGTATIGPVRENGLCVGVEVSVPVSLPAFTIGAVVGGLCAGTANIMGMW